MEKLENDFNGGGDIADLLDLKVYFETDSFSLPPAAAIELDKLTQFLIKRPELALMITCHTDSRGDARYNQVLSENRAQTIKNYLVSQGIGANRIMKKGLGETRILNHCVNNVPCTEKEHLANRRVEFELLIDRNK